jgi:hypothetical protein
MPTQLKSLLEINSDMPAIAGDTVAPPPNVK